jgi:hypothetical protein
LWTGAEGVKGNDVEPTESVIVSDGWVALGGRSTRESVPVARGNGSEDTVGRCSARTEGISSREVIAAVKV